MGIRLSGEYHYDCDLLMKRITELESFVGEISQQFDCWGECEQCKNNSTKAEELLNNAT